MPRFSLQILAFLLFITLPFHGNSQSTQDITHEERTILVKLKEYWSNPPPHLTTAGGQRSDGSVIAIDLYYYNIPGPVPQLICDLKNLRVLNLGLNLISENQLTGTIPDEFGKLTKLTVVALFSNELSGEVPASMAMLPALQDFALWRNNISGQLPSGFGKHSKLRSFQVSFNHFVGNLSEHLCAKGELVALEASDNKLTGTLPRTFGNCNSLNVFRVYGNGLSGKIPDGLWTATSLSQLIIRDNSFTGQLPGTVGLSLSEIDIR